MDATAEMDLDKFSILIKDWICKNAFNVQLSGVAEISNGANVLWSASLAVIGQGQFPSVEPVKIQEVRTLVQKFSLSCDFVLSKVQSVKFVMGPDLRSRRWQIMWLFRE